MLPTRSRVEDAVSQLRSCSNARCGTAKSSREGATRSRDLAELERRRSTGMQQRVGPMPVRRRRRRHTSGQWESAQQCRHHRGVGTEHLIVRCGQVSPRFRGQGSTPRVDTLAAGRAASLLARFSCAHEHHGPLAQLVRAHG